VSNVLSDVRSFHVYSTYRFTQCPNCSYLKCAQTPGSLAGTGEVSFLRAPVPQGYGVVRPFRRVADPRVGVPVALAGFHDGSGRVAVFCRPVKSGISRFSSLGINPWPRFQALASPSQALRPGPSRGLQNVSLAFCDVRLLPGILLGASGKILARPRSSSRAVVLPCPAPARFSCPTVETFSRHGPQAWTSCSASRVGCDVVVAPAATMTGISMSFERGVRDLQRMRVQFACPVPVLLPAQVVGLVLVA